MYILYTYVHYISANVRFYLISRGTEPNSLTFSRFDFTISDFSMADHIENIADSWRDNRCVDPPFFFFFFYLARTERFTIRDLNFDDFKFILKCISIFDVCNVLYNSFQFLKYTWFSHAIDFFFFISIYTYCFIYIWSSINRINFY